jgi:hypothetical protein
MFAWIAVGEAKFVNKFPLISPVGGGGFFIKSAIRRG